MSAVPLPEPWDYCYEWDGPYGSRKFSAALHNGMPPDRSVPIHTADQMRAYGDARAAAAVERALDAVDECPGLTMKQDRWLSAAIRASAKPAPAHGAAPDTPRTSRTP